jgi:hypothetical protein
MNSEAISYLFQCIVHRLPIFGNRKINEWLILKSHVCWLLWRLSLFARRICIFFRGVIGILLIRRVRKQFFPTDLVDKPRSHK